MVRGTLELLLLKMEDRLSLRDRVSLGVVAQPAKARKIVRALLRDAIGEFREKNADAPTFEADADGESDTPILDFLRELIAQGKIQPFIAFLFEQIPILIAAIVKIFAVI